MKGIIGFSEIHCPHIHATRESIVWRAAQIPLDDGSAQLILCETCYNAIVGYVVRDIKLDLNMPLDEAK
jgi:hypothetical protein